jgi:hypothetical protein
MERDGNGSAENKEGVCLSCGSCIRKNEKVIEAFDNL